MAQERNRVVKDGLLLLITLACGLSCYVYFYNRGLGLPVIGYSLAPAERVLQGEGPYRDFLYDYGPGVLWVNALLMKLLGVTLMASRIGLLGFKVATLIAVAFVSRRLTSALAALVPVALMLAWPGYGQIFNVHPDQYFILFALAGLAFMLQYDKSGNNKWLALCGVTAGLIFLFKYNAGILLLAAGALIVVTRARATEDSLPQSLGRPSETLKAAAIYLAGFAVVAAPLIVYLIYNYALGAMIHHLMFHAAAYNDAISIHLTFPNEALLIVILLVPVIGVGFLLLFAAGRVFPLYAIAAMAYGSMVVIQSYKGKTFNSSVVSLVAYFPPLIFLIAAIGAIWQLKHSGGRAASWWKRNGAIIIAGLFAFAVYLDLFPRPDFYHLVRIFPPLFVFLCALLVRWKRVLTEQLKKRPVPWPGLNSWLIVAAAVVFLVVAGERNCWQHRFFPRHWFLAERELAIDRGRGIMLQPDQAAFVEGLVRVIQDNSAPDDPIFSFPQSGSAFYFLAARKNPTQFLWWSSIGISEEETKEVASLITTRQLKLILVAKELEKNHLKDQITANYHPVGLQDDIAVYSRNE